MGVREGHTERGIGEHKRKSSKVQKWILIESISFGMGTGEKDSEDNLSEEE